MSGELACSRCGASIEATEDHTEIVRRDFEDVPQPSRIEHLCRSCWADYESFLDDGG